MGPIPPCLTTRLAVSNEGIVEVKTTRLSYHEEHPLQHLAVIIRLLAGIECELARGVIVLPEVEQDSCSLEHREVLSVGIDEHRDAPVRVQLDEPRLFLRVLGDIDGVNAS